MPYSIMLWLVNPGDQTEQAEALQMLDRHRAAFPGAHAGINEPPALGRLSYGLFDTTHEAQQALDTIAKQLSKNQPLRIAFNNGRTFLVPAQRVHYAVLCPIERPIDHPEKQLERAYGR